jgi:hypothetical protein
VPSIVNASALGGLSVIGHFGVWVRHFTQPGAEVFRVLRKSLMYVAFGLAIELRRSVSEVASKHASTKP